MSQWITDRLPTVEDADRDGAVLGMRDGVVIFQIAKCLLLGEPWQPLPAPYVKPKRWTAHWNKLISRWNIVGEDGSCVATLRIDVDGISTAQRIADIYNEVVP